MTSKKYTLLAGLGLLIGSTGFAQTTTESVRHIYGLNNDVTDSSFIPNRRLAQHSEFLAGTYDYPAKPRDMWEIGIKGGSFSIPIADIDARYGKSFGFGAHIRKALGHTLSLRLEYVYGVAQGLNWRPSSGSAGGASGIPTGYMQGASAGNPWAANYGGRAVYQNYQTKAQELSLQALVTLGNIRFYKAQTGATIYALAGIGATTYRTKVNALNSAGQPYSANDFPAGSQWYEDRKDAMDVLKDVFDGKGDSFESPAERDPSKKWSKMFAGYISPSATVGLGAAFRLSSRINLAIEDRIIFNNSDMLDGNRWAEQPSFTQDKDAFNYLTVGLNFNLGNKSKRVEPLYWVNPLNYAYSEIRNPRLMNIPEPVLVDTDGDGVVDQFDLEQTPAGCPVDTHGVSLDTDGDGVPDCRDKEKNTPTYCQPVDADGVGKCPCPEGCGPVKTECATTLGALPSVSFKAGTNTLSADAPAVLATVAAKLRNSPGCKVVVVGYCAATKKQQQLSWDHVNKVISHLVEKEGISSDRFIFSSGQEGGDCNTVDIRAAAEGEDGPNQVAPPHPNLRKN